MGEHSRYKPEGSVTFNTLHYLTDSNLQRVPDDYILLAVNSHQQLVEALEVADKAKRLLVDYMATLSQIGERSVPASTIVRKLNSVNWLLSKSTAALKAAGEEG